MISQTILIIEDEERIAHWVQSYFERASFQTLVARNGRTGLDMALEKKQDLIVLDLMLPGLDGRELCQQVRRHSEVPIIMLTARDGQQDRIAGLGFSAQVNNKGVSAQVDINVCSRRFSAQVNNKRVSAQVDINVCSRRFSAQVNNKRVSA
jgi:DNA-binding response OmpR family regulator